MWTPDEKHTHIITYEQTILRSRPTQVRNKTLCFLQNTHMWTQRSVIWLCSMLTVVVDELVTNGCEWRPVPMKYICSGTASNEAQWQWFLHALEKSEP